MPPPSNWQARWRDARLFRKLARAIVAEGDIPVVLLDVGGGCVHYVESFVLWSDGSDWHLQSLEALLPNARDHGTTLTGTWPYTPERSLASGPTARAILDGGVVRLGVIVGQAGCGSGPHETYALVSLVDGDWNLSWDGAAAFAGQIGQTAVEFSGEGMDTIAVKGTSFRRSDLKSQIFFEGKIGPHRYFDQIWQRQGGEYELAGETVRPWSYNTLVEFVYRLSTGDYVGAETLTSDPALLDSAEALGLAQSALYPLWAAYCREAGGSSGSPCIIEMRERDGQGVLIPQHGVRVTMSQEGTDWLISAIEPCTPSYDGATGGRCD